MYLLLEKNLVKIIKILFNYQIIVKLYLKILI